MARPLGSREISIDAIKTIVELSLNREDRSVIADKADVSKHTVYKYQKTFGLV